MKEKIRNILIVIILIILLIIINSLFRSKFKSGQCVEDYRDGYIWQINDFSFGKYRLMGWLGNSWGNSVKMDKGVLERTDAKGTPIYHLIPCPEISLQ